MSNNISSDFYNIVVNVHDDYKINFKCISQHINKEGVIYTQNLQTGEYEWYDESIFKEKKKSEVKSIDLIALSISSYRKLKDHKCFYQPKVILIVKPKNKNKNKNSFIDEYYTNESAFLDKLSFTLKVSDDLGDEFIKLLVREKLCSSTRPRDTRIYKCRVSNKSQHMTFEYMPTKKNTSYIKCTFNPAKTDVRFLRLVFSQLKFVIGPSYESLIRTSNLLRIDFAIDLKEEKVKDFYLNLNSSRHITLYLDHKGKVETKVYGKNGTRLQIYNKLRERNLKCKVPITRCEIQLKKLNSKFDLESLFDIFHRTPNIREYSMKGLKERLSISEYYLIKKMGITAARSTLISDSEKQKLRRHLNLAEKGSFGERLVGSTRNELRAIQKLLFNP
ncbi:hypothetical protein ACQKC7_09890 [Pseudoalteromonas tetraodonis]|uniref:hypothetical protein n=1 Tax=Pseudoalteromonas tetraodonis TaxID=43659 RepID=UPI003D025B94